METNITPQKPEKAKLSNGQTREELIDRLPIPGPGRPKLTEEEKIKRRAEKEMVKKYLKEYEENLAEALPEIEPALIEQAKKGNIKAIREVHEVLGAHKRGPSTVVPIQINFNEDKEKYA